MSEHEEYRSLFLDRDELITKRIPVTVNPPIGNTGIIRGDVLPKDLSKDLSNDLSKDQDIKK